MATAETILRGHKVVSRRPGVLKDNRVQLRHPNPNKKMPQMARSSYVLARKTALNVLPKQAPGIALEEFLDAMATRLPNVKGWDGSASARWWAMAIKLDMEARGEIQRVNKKPPQRLVRTVARSRGL